MVSFIHVADLHLDSPFKGLIHLSDEWFEAVQNSTFQAFEQIVSQAIKNAVDFVVIAGDLYDVSERSIRAQTFLREQFKRLNTAQINVYIIYGNHDFIDRQYLYIDMPENVHIFDETPETIYYQSAQGETVAISGFSYDQQHIKENRLQKYPPRDMTADYHIGLLHGNCQGIETPSSVYAPFSVADVRRLNYDYLALGHIHKRGSIHSSLPAYYSGNIQGRHRKELGDKGCYLVKCEQGQCHPEFISAAPIIWEAITVNMSEVTSLQQALNKITQVLHEQLERQANKRYLIDLTCQFEELDAALVAMLTTDQINQLIDSSDYWITHITCEKQTDQHLIDSFIERYPSAWQKAIHSVTDDDHFTLLQQELQTQVPLKYWQQDWDHDFKERIKQQAIQAIEQALVDNE